MRIVSFLNLVFLSLAIYVSGVFTVEASPYFSKYQGISADSSFPSVGEGQEYSVTLVFDNGGVASTNQTWGINHLTCVKWESGEFSYAQAISPGDAFGGGSVVTDYSGQLVSIYTDVQQHFALNFFYVNPEGGRPSSVSWFANNYNGVFYNQDDQSAIRDVLGGVMMSPSYWTAPEPYRDECNIPGIFKNGFE